MKFLFKIIDLLWWERFLISEIFSTKYNPVKLPRKDERGVSLLGMITMSGAAVEYEPAPVLDAEKCKLLVRQQ